MHRLFVGIRPPVPVLDALADVQDGIDGARWQSDEQLHLTLRFVGEVERPLANDLAESLGAITAPPFMLEGAGTGHFERKGRPHAVWARITPSPELDLLQRRVERACQQAGLPPEGRRYLPHVTLARLPGRSGPIGGWLADTGTLRLPAWPVADFILYESHLGKGGSIYRPIVTYPLGATEMSAVPVSRTGR
jgi:RNA 2',3'-cyclic 3'-phosphodiesterase